jgi:hypothetical protein
VNLLDGLNYYKSYSHSDWDFTLRVESFAVEVLKMISLHGDQPNAAALAAAHVLLVDIEKWKAMCLKERMGNAEQNSPQAAWNAFRGAVDASNDLEAILSIMQLRGFGSTEDEETGQRRAKVATAVLRFLKPRPMGCRRLENNRNARVLKESQRERRSGFVSSGEREANRTS